jgi:hypothetical protein
MKNDRELRRSKLSVHGARYSYLNSGRECTQTMLCPEYKDRVLLIRKGKSVCTSCVSTGIGSEFI